MTSDETLPLSAMSVRWSAQRDSILLTGRLVGVAFTLVAAALAFALVFIGVGGVLLARLAWVCCMVGKRCVWDLPPLMDG